MADSKKFSEVVIGLEIGKSLSAESPLNFMDERLKIKVIGRTETGLTTMKVSLMGIHLGVLRGKPGTMGSYRFTDE